MKAGEATRMTLLMKEEDKPCIEEGELPGAPIPSIPTIVTSYPNIARRSLISGLKSFFPQTCRIEDSSEEPERYVAASLVEKYKKEKKLADSESLNVGDIEELMSRSKSNMKKNLRYLRDETGYYFLTNTSSSRRINTDILFRPLNFDVVEVGGKTEEIVRNGDFGRTSFAFDLVRSGKTAKECNLIAFGDPVLESNPGLYYAPRRNSSERQPPSQVMDSIDFLREKIKATGVPILDGLGKKFIEKSLKPWAYNSSKRKM